MNSQQSKSTYYRRLRRSKEMGCPVDELPDNRGKHDNHAKGSKHPRWNNGRMINAGGHVKIRVGINHILADDNGYAFEHVVVWVSNGNAIPQPGEVIHHINGDKLDNRIENLSLVTIAEHNKIHNAERGRDKLGRFIPLHLDGVEWDEFPEEVTR